MKEVHAISIIGIIYSIILGLVAYIFFKDFWFFAVLGSAVSLFNHSRMIYVTKGQLKVESLVIHIISRYVIYMIIIVFVFFDTQGQSEQFILNSYIFLLLGFIATKIGVYVYHTPLIKKPVEEKEVVEDHEVSD